MKKVVVSLAISIILVVIVAIPASAKEYHVVKGDTLWDIAQEHQTTVKDLKELNGLTNDLIFPEQTLQINKEETYVVQKGDTLSEIGVEYDVDAEDLMEWNDLTSDLIIIGQELTIKIDQTNQSDQAVRTAASTSVSNQQSSTEQEPQKLTVTATAYTAECEGCSGITYTGINLLNDRDKKVIAVDPSVIPLGSRVYVEGYGEAIAGDIGGAIKGHRIDLHVPTKDEAFEWGVREVEVTILD